MDKKILGLSIEYSLKQFNEDWNICFDSSNIPIV